MMRKDSLFGLFLLVTYVECYHYRYDYKYYEELDGWLKYHIVPANFSSAFKRCHAEGAILAYPNGDLFKQAMLELNKENGGFYEILTGIHSIFSAGDYTASDGLPLDKISVTWAASQPFYVNTINSACTIMRMDGTLRTAECSDGYPYICYRKKTNVNDIGRCGTIDKHYSFDNRTGSCYKFHHIGLTWRQAYMTCLAEGGYLAIINDALEATIMKEIYEKHPSSKIVARSKDAASIGFYDMGERAWFTIHGQSLSEVYSTFEKYEPDQNPASDCGGMLRNGLLINVNCIDTTKPFICEKDPDSINCETLI